jgi:hypothetical protein
MELESSLTFHVNLPLVPILRQMYSDPRSCVTFRKISSKVKGY